MSDGTHQESMVLWQFVAATGGWSDALRRGAPDAVAQHLRHACDMARALQTEPEFQEFVALRAPGVDLQRIADAVSIMLSLVSEAARSPEYRAGR